MAEQSRPVAFTEADDAVPPSFAPTRALLAAVLASVLIWLGVWLVIGSPGF